MSNSQRPHDRFRTVDQNNLIKIRIKLTYWEEGSECQKALDRIGINQIISRSQCKKWQKITLSKLN
jgi:hypothetical protein